MLYAFILNNEKGSEKFEKVTKIYLAVNNLSYFTAFKEHVFHITFRKTCGFLSQL